MLTPGTRRINPHSIYLAILLVLSSGLALLALIIPYSTTLSQDHLQLGMVAPQDILAPHNLTYNSDLLTAAQRQMAAADVAPIYSQADTNAARRQLERLRAALALMTSIRSDAYASQDQKISDLAALEYIPLSPDAALAILSLPAARWPVIQQESFTVLEQVMRSTIREDHLEDARRSIPTLISLSLSEEQANIVANLVSALVTPNSLYEKDQTEAARQKAQDAVQPVMRTFVTGERIVQGGEIITAIDLEVLSHYGMTAPKYRWQDLASGAALVLVAMAFLGVYLKRNPALTSGPQANRALSLMAVLFSVFLLTARVSIPGHTLIPYIFPFAAYSLLIATLFGAELALITSLPLAFLITYSLPFALELTMYYVMSSFFGVLTLGRGKRITHFFWAASVIGCCGAAVILAYRLPQSTTDWVGLATLTAAAFANGVISASLALIFQFFLAQLLGMTTALQLMELSRPDHPLMQVLLRSAPGTYQHSLQVANLVEQAAERIGADALLTRIGALYHDAGKAVNSVFFIENQVPGDLNPHDDLDPVVSAAMIIRHIPEGLNLARKYRLPRRIQDFIAEHHGRMLTNYQYRRALVAADGDESRVDKEKFRYPGPRPQSRETALLMLADGCEAKVRAERPKDEIELRLLIKSIIDNRVAVGALKDTGLTLHDLDIIEDSFTTTLRGIYHPRIQYPSLDTLLLTNEDAAEAQFNRQDLASRTPNEKTPEETPPVKNQNSTSQHSDEVPTRPASLPPTTLNTDSGGVSTTS